MLELILNYWIEILLTTITSGIIYIFKQYISLKNGMIALLRNEIIRIYDNQILLGYCSNYMKENIREMYENYHKLGGNGFITKLVNKLYDLPNKGDDMSEEKNTISNS